jgi:hypothetical protein
VSNLSFAVTLCGFFALMWGFLPVSDLLFVAVIVGFFALAWGFQVVCDRSRESVK